MYVTNISNLNVCELLAAKVFNCLLFFNDHIPMIALILPLGAIYIYTSKLDYYQLHQEIGNVGSCNSRDLTKSTLLTVGPLITNYVEVIIKTL